MKIVVTGALGHIGSRLIRELPGSFPGAEIPLIDNLLTQRYCSLFGLNQAGGRYRFIEADVLKVPLAPIIAGASAVVHLAAITDAASTFDKKELVEEVNHRGAEIVARACVAAGVPLLALSTTSVYGSQADLVDETCAESELQPQSPYAESKLKMEKMLAGLRQREGLRFVVCRFGTIFGVSPGMRFHTAVNKFIWQACLGQPISVWRTALHQQRPYLDLGDACRAIAHILRQDLFDGGTYNVLTLNATVNDIVEAIRVRRPDLQVQLVDSPIMNQLSYKVSGDKFRRTGFACTGDLAAAVRETIDWLDLTPAGGKK